MHAVRWRRLAVLLGAHPWAVGASAVLFAIFGWLVLHPFDGSFGLALFVLLCAWVMLAGSAQQELRMRLAHVMRRGPPPATAPSVVKMGAGPAAIHPAVKPMLRVDLVREAAMTAPSAAAALLLAATRTCQARSLKSLWRGTWLLLIADSAVALVGEATHMWIPGNVVGVGTVATLAARFTIGRTRDQNNAVPAAIASFARLGWLLITGLLVLCGAMHAARTGTWLPLLIAGTALVTALVMSRVERLRLRRRVLAGHPPLRLMVLWVFGSHSGLISLMGTLGAQWMWLGSVAALEVGTVVGTRTGQLWAWLRGRERDLMAESPAEIEQVLRDWSLPSAPYWRSVLCTDGVWQFAVDRLLDASELVLMDLAGFSPSSRGCAWELGRLIDRVPSNRFLLLVDETTDQPFFMQTLNAAWEGMAGHSPNAVPGAHAIRVLDLGDLRRESPQRGRDPARFEREADVLMTALCEVTVAAGLHASSPTEA